jgi:hypothetical protein
MKQRQQIRRVWWGTLVLLLGAMCAGGSAAAVLYDFESNAAGWNYTEPKPGRAPQPSAEQASAGKASLKLDAAFPGHVEVSVKLERADWSEHNRISLKIFLPADAPRSTQAMLFLKDRDHHWYQHLRGEYLRPGAWNTVSADISGASKAWEYSGHFHPWNGATTREIVEFGIRVFSKDGNYSGAIYLDEIALSDDGGNAKAAATALSDNGFIRNLRVNSATIGRHEKFEVTFELPKDYENPFLPDEVAVEATFVSPTQKRVVVPGFYYQDYLRERGELGEKMTTLGRGVWKVRFAPTELGRYTYRITATDRATNATTREFSFVCEPSQNPGYVRVAEGTPEDAARYFEFSNGAFFFPIGHNIRSPFDDRYANASWASLRRRQSNLGLFAYDRYFEQMQANGENFAEVWMASWWLALEWKSNAPGYHGIGQYNLLHAWKLDHLLDTARDRGIYLLLVVNNHGKFSTWCDAEWAANPFNKANGGPFESPEEFFTDPRGAAAMRHLLRYLVARWGYSTQVFGWKLMSEINLTGSGGGFHRTPTMRNWHRDMAALLKEIDPWKHPVTTHYSGDYRVQDPQLVALPGLDFNTVDAYHGVPNCLNIIQLINETCQFNRQFNKPVIITEFGGSSGGMPAKVLRQELHNALWASVCSPAPSTPLFWWWMFIDENNLYPMFKPIAAFMRGQDRRGERLEAAPELVELTGPTTAMIGTQALLGDHSAYVWLFDRNYFSGPLHEEDAMAHEGLRLKLLHINDGTYIVEVWDTYTGIVVSSERVAANEGMVDFEVPVFKKDVAVKVKPAAEQAQP